MRKLLSFLILASALSSGATEVGGIAYELNYDGSEATVIALENGKYTGVVTIPEKVTIDGKELPVTEIGDDAFYDCDGLTAVNLPSTISFIGTFAFKDCTSLKEFVMPESLYMINGYAFDGCKALKTITFNSQINTISDYVFRDCPDIDRINISDIDAWFEIDFGNTDANPLRYAHDLYLNDKKITEIVIPDTVWEVCKYALAGSSVEKITVGSGVSEIGWYAFSECENLKEVVLNCQLDALDYGVFYGDKALTTLTLPSGITKIGNYVFQGCSSLKSLTLPEGLTTLGFMSFAESGLESITIPKGVNDIGAEVFKDCTSLKSAAFSPDTKITEIPTYMFSGCTALSEFNIPATITKINDSAFTGCESLSSIAIPSSVSKIGATAFSGCTGLKRVDITDLAAWCEILFTDGSSNPLMLAGNLYLNNELVTDVTIPESTKRLYPFVFRGASCLITATLPTTLTAIPKYAFSGCTSLESIEIPYSVSQIDESAFADDEALTQVKISDLPSWCNITFANIQSNPLVYANSLVLNGTPIEKLELPVSVSNIKDYTFAGGHFAEIAFPSTVKSIGNSAFSGNSLIETLTFGNSLTTLGNSSFADNSALKQLTLPASLSSILNDAFAGCNKIELIFAKAESPAAIGTEGDTERHVFTNEVKASARLYVPAAALDKYKEATEWMLFKNISTFDVENPAVVNLTFNSELGAVTDDQGKDLEPQFIAEANSIFTFWIKPAAGASVESMSWNGDDVPMSPNGGTYMAATVDGVNNLVVNFAKSDAIEAVETDSQAIEVITGGIITGCRATVYSIEGRRVAETDGGFTALSAGIYIVDIDGRTSKVLVR